MANDDQATVPLTPEIVESLQNEVRRLKAELTVERTRVAKALGIVQEMFEFKPDFMPDEVRKDPDVKKGERIPFYTESYLYALLGKDDARSVLYRLERALETLKDEEAQKQVKWVEALKAFHDAASYYIDCLHREKSGDLKEYEKKEPERAARAYWHVRRKFDECVREGLSR